MSNQIKKIRLQLGLSRKEFAALLNITSAAISNYEYGIRDPKLFVCHRLIKGAKSYNLTLNLDDILILQK